MEPLLMKKERRVQNSSMYSLTSWLLYLFYSEWNTLLGRRPVRISHWGLFQSRCLHYLMVIVVVDAWPRCCFSPGLLIRQRRAFFVETSLVFDFQLWSLIFIDDWYFPLQIWKIWLKRKPRECISIHMYTSVYIWYSYWDPQLAHLPLLGRDFFIIIIFEK